MSELPPAAPNADAPPPGAPRRRTPAAAPPIHRVTVPDLARRAVLEKTRSRLLVASAGFTILFAAVVIKLAGATVVMPIQPKRLARLPDALPALAAQTVPNPAAPGTDAPTPAPARDPALPRTRATITDRNGTVLAMSIPTAALYANPQEMIDVGEAAQKLKSVLPKLDADTIRARLGSAKQFVYLARNITPREQMAVNNLGIPGVYFEPTERRRYPQARLAAHAVGAVDVDSHGVSGIERFFDQRLRESPEPLRLSIDVRVQSAMRDELAKSMAEFQAIGACGIVMDVRTGEVIAMVSLPDFDANALGTAKEDERFNRAVTGMYEPGSTFKLQTAALSLDSGVGKLWMSYDAAHDIKIGRFTIQDFQGKHRALTFPEVLAYSSNLGAAHMAQAVGGERQRTWLGNMGMLSRIGVELPEEGRPIVQRAENWKEIATMTVGFGHGIAVSPLHVVRGTAAIANGGIVLRPTLVAVEPGAVREGTRVMQQSTSDTMRRLMRLVVTDGYGKPADVPGYFVGGKTGTAEKTSRAGYKKHTNISAFMSVFPMNSPRYAVYFMLDEPKGNASTGGYSTAGAVSAPGAGRVIARIGPMLGLMPEAGAQAIATQNALAIPMQVPRGYAVPAGAPVAVAAPVAAPAPASAPASPPAPGQTIPAKPAIPTVANPARHREANLGAESR